jgi:hypothetical protein
MELGAQYKKRCTNKDSERISAGTTAGMPTWKHARCLARVVACAVKKELATKNNTFKPEAVREEIAAAEPILLEHRSIGMAEEPEQVPSITEEFSTVQDKELNNWTKFGFDIWSAILSFAMSNYTQHDGRHDELVEIVYCLRNCPIPEEAPKKFWSQMCGFKEAWDSLEWCAPLYPMLKDRKKNYSSPYASIVGVSVDDDKDTAGPGTMPPILWTSLNGFLARLVAIIGNEAGFETTYLQGFYALVEALEVDRTYAGLDHLLPAAVQWIIYAKHTLGSVDNTVMGLEHQYRSTVDAETNRCPQMAGEAY